MKRDLETIRKIVLLVEQLSTGTVIDDIQIEGYSAAQIGYHCYLIIDAGLAKGIDVTSAADTSPDWRILHLTSAGHDFADLASNEATWKKATGLVKDKAGGATIEIIKDVLISVIKETLGL